jgi:hypothetical protein
MSLDLSKLQKVVELSDGVKRAKCPACAESGSDKSGQHLRIYPDGKFGCCVFPGDREHRKRIFALVGNRTQQGIRVRVAASPNAKPIQSGVLGRLGRSFVSPTRTDGPDGVSEVECEILDEEESRTLRTGEPNWNIDTEETDTTETELRTARTGKTECTEELFTDERTLRTPQLSLVLQQEHSEIEKYKTHIYKDFDEGVRCVRLLPAGGNGTQLGQKLPYLTSSGDLVIPFDSPERYHWWKSGQSVKETLAELRERAKEVENGTVF